MGSTAKIQFGISPYYKIGGNAVVNKIGVCDSISARVRGGDSNKKFTKIEHQRGLSKIDGVPGESETYKRFLEKKC